MKGLDGVSVGDPPAAALCAKAWRRAEALAKEGELRKSHNDVLCRLTKVRFFRKWAFWCVNKMVRMIFFDTLCALQTKGRSMVGKEDMRNVLKQARRIAVIGNSGSGKSTVARKVYDFCNLPLHHLDTYFWKPNWTPPNRDEYKIIHDGLCD